MSLNISEFEIFSAVLLFFCLLFGRFCSCVDIDECADGSDNCSATASCADMTPGFTCTCDSGYTGDGEICTSKETELDFATYQRFKEL